MQIKVRIRPNGEVEIDVEGVQGEACLKLTEFLEEALGEVVAREMTSEYYIKVKAEQRLPAYLDGE